MDEHVLVGYDESTQAKAALRHALEKYPDAQITVIHVNDPREWMTDTDEFDGFYSEEMYERVQESAEKTLEQAEEFASEFDHEVETTTAMGRPAAEVVQFAEENDVDHIIVGSHGRRGISRFLLGSVAEKIVRRSPVPVTVIRGEKEESEE